MQKHQIVHLPPRPVVAASFAVAAAILGDSLLYAVLPTIWPSLGIEVAMVGVLLSANRFVRLGSNPVAAWVMARVGSRAPFLVAVFAGAATTLAYASGLGFAVLLAARLLWGICWSFLRLGGQIVALEAAGAQRRGYYLGFFNGVTRFGSFVAVLLGGILTDVVGFRATVILFTVINLIGGAAIIRDVLRASPAAPLTTGHAAQPVAAPASPVVMLAAKEPTGQRRPTLARWLVYVVGFIHGLAVSGLVTATLGLWLLRLYGPSPELLFLSVGVATLTGSLLSARFLADFLWGPIAGHLSDRHGRLRIAAVAGVLEISALVWLSATGSLVATILASLLLFVAATALQAALDAIAGDMAPPARRARVLGWYATWLDLGAAAGPLAGYLLGVGLGLSLLYQAAALLLAVVGSVALAVWRQSSVEPRSC